MPPWLRWLSGNWAHLQKFWKLAVPLAIVVMGCTWYVTDYLFTIQVSNLQSEVDLLKSQLADVDRPVGPLPTYSLGGSDVLHYRFPNWTTQDTAREVKLDWDRLVDVDAYAVLRMRTSGTSTSTWVQARIMNITNREVVATTKRHRGGKVLVRLQLPCATGAKTYSMEVRGEGAGLEGNIELLPAT